MKKKQIQTVNHKPPIVSPVTGKQVFLEHLLRSLAMQPAVVIVIDGNGAIDKPLTELASRKKAGSACSCSSRIHMIEGYSVSPDSTYDSRTITESSSRSSGESESISESHGHGYTRTFGNTK